MSGINQDRETGEFKPGPKADMDQFPKDSRECAKLDRYILAEVLETPPANITADRRMIIRNE